MEWAARYLGRNGGAKAIPGEVESFCDFFRAFNPRFDEDRFRAAVKKHTMEDLHADDPIH